MEFSQWSSIFDSAAVAGEIASPGVAGLQVLLQGHGMRVEDEQLAAAFTLNSWEPSHTFSKDDFIGFMQHAVQAQNDALVRRIADRVDSHEFPCVQPSDLEEGGAQDVAKAALEFLLKTEQAEVQSYVDQKYAEFRALSPTDESVPEPVRRAKFMYSSFYGLVVDFHLQKSYENKQLRHRFTDGVFVPVIPVASIGDAAKRAAAAAAAAQMKAALMGVLEKRVWAGWDLLTRHVMPSPDLFMKFMTAEYFEVLADVVSAASSPTVIAFVPRVAPEDVAGADVRELERILQGMTGADGAATEAAVEKMWTQYTSSLSASMKALLPNAPTEAFWHENYYSVAAQILADRAMAESGTAHARFTPRVLPADAVAANVEECEEIARAMTEADGAAVEVAVEKMWKDYASGFPGSLRSLLPPAPTREFWEEKYYEVAAQIIGSHPSALAIAPEVRAPSQTPLAKRARVADQVLPSDAVMGVDGLLNDAAGAPSFAAGAADAVEYIGSIRMHELTRTDGYWNYEGHVIHFDDQPRVTGQADQGKSPKKSPVKGGASVAVKTGVAIDVLMLDRTGPAMVTLFDDAARDFFHYGRGSGLRGRLEEEGHHRAHERPPGWTARKQMEREDDYATARSSFKRSARRWAAGDQGDARDCSQVAVHAERRPVCGSGDERLP